MLPHAFLGYSLSELGSIFLLITGFGGWFIWLVNHFITRPLQDSINNLANTVQDFKNSSKEEHREFKDHFEKLDKKLEEHELKLTRDNEEIKTLFNRKEKDNYEK